MKLHHLVLCLISVVLVGLGNSDNLPQAFTPETDLPRSSPQNNTPSTQNEDVGQGPPIPPLIPQTDARDQVQQKLQFDTLSIIGLVFACIFVMIAAGGGIGGGGVLVPTYIFLLSFKPKVAIPLSNITIFGSSIANCVLNFRKRHPEANRPLIDWDVMLMMEPVTIAGALVGSIVNVLLPPWLLTILLIILLTATAHRTLKKGCRKFQEESKVIAANNTVQTTAISTEEGEVIPLFNSPRSPQFPSSPQPTKTTLDTPIKTKYGSDGVGPSSPARIEKVSDGSLDIRRNGEVHKIRPADSARLRTIYNEEKTHSWIKVTALIVLQLGVLALTLFKGGGDVNVFKMECGSISYWMMSLAVLPYVLIFTYYARKYLIDRFHEKRALGYRYVEGDVLWDSWSTIKYPAICSIAGLCAGLFGIGGGIVKGPLMLEMGVIPEVASATSATMILLTSSAATLSYFVFSSLNLYYAMLLFPLGFVFTLFGQVAVDVIVKRWGRPSMIIFVIGFVVALSAVAMGIEGGKSIVHVVRGQAEPGGSLCDAVV